MKTAFPPLIPSEPPRVFGAPTLHTERDLLALGIAGDGTVWSVEEPGRLRQWNLGTRKQLTEHVLDELATVWSFNWAARLLGSASDEVAVWEISSGEQLVSWTNKAWVTALAFQPGAPILATGDDDARVRVWNWIDKKQLFDLRGHEHAISAVAFSPDRKWLATACEGRLIHLWDIRDGKLVGTLRGHTDRIPALAWHPDSRRLFSAGWDTTVRVWDTQAFEPIILLNSHATQVHTLALSADGKLLASADSDNAVHVWLTDENRTLAVLREQTGEVRCLAFTPDDGKGNLAAPVLAWGSADRVIHLWDSKQLSVGGTGVDSLTSRTLVAVSPDGKRLYSLGAGTDLRTWDVSTGTSALVLEGEPLLRSFSASADGKWIAAARGVPTPSGSAPRRDRGKNEDRTTLALYEAASGKRQSVCEGQPAPITALAFSPDATLLASGSVQSSDVWLWKVPSGEPLLLIPDAVEDCSVDALAFQPGGQLLAIGGIDWLATGEDDGEVVLWGVDERRMKHALSGGATAIAFDPTGRLLACAGLNHTIRVWDVQDNRVVRQEEQAHADTISCLAWSPDGRLLASGGDDRVIRLWNTAGGELAGAWELDNPIESIAFTTDGKYLFTGNGNTSCYQIELERVLASGM